MLLELEKECLEAYERKVSHLQQAIADSEAELADIRSAMREGPVNVRQFDQHAGGSLVEALCLSIASVQGGSSRITTTSSSSRSSCGDVSPGLILFN